MVKLEMVRIRGFHVKDHIDFSLFLNKHPKLRPLKTDSVSHVHPLIIQIYPRVTGSGEPGARQQQYNSSRIRQSGFFCCVVFT